MEHYWTNNKKLKDEQKTLRINFNDKVYSIMSNSGVFSKETMDYGTRLLLESIDIENIKGKVLDLGCGYGIVGVILGNINNNITIDMCDINERALLLSNKNLKINNIKNANTFISNNYENVTKKYSYIITNPPIRTGKEMIRKFLFGAKDHLEDNGELWFVMRKNHGVLSMIKELESIYKVNIVTKDKGFYIVQCTL